MTEDQKPEETTSRQVFYNSLYEKFRELRPQYIGDTPDPTNPVFQQLFIIDQTLTNPDLFDAGMSLWLEDNDIDKFLEGRCADVFSEFNETSDDPTTPTQ